MSDPKPIKITQSLQIYTSQESDCFYFKQNGSCVVSLFDVLNSHGIIFIFHSSDQKLLVKSRALQTLVEYAQNHEKTEIKIIGPSALCQLAATLIQSKNVSVTKEVYRDNEFEGYFFSKEGRIRLTAQAEPVKKERPIRVMIVDDSKTIRQLLSQVIGSDPELEVVATISNPLEVEKNILALKPDVITLDIHMPEMDGVTLLKNLIPKYRIPIVMITSISMDEGPLVLNALENGAVDYIQKPSFKELAIVSSLIQEKIKNASRARVSVRKAGRNVSRSIEQGSINPKKIVAIGSSTGGTEALKEILTQLPEKIPPIVIVQHIPPIFSLAFANRMDQLCPFEVKEAVDGDLILPNRVIIAQGNTQMRVVRNGNRFKIRVDDSPPVNRHKPSVDVLFSSVAKEIKDQAVGIILTGMGSDGAEGLLEMKKAGATTFAQSERTCVVFGMPKEAVKAGGVDQVKDLEEMAECLLKAVSK
jgi:two-component system chemotaxis response regulator CheB